MRVLAIFICLILYAGIFPRELQEGAPTVFMLGGVLIALIVNNVFKK